MLFCFLQFPVPLISIEIVIDAYLRQSKKLEIFLFNSNNILKIFDRDTFKIVK